MIFFDATEGAVVELHRQPARCRHPPDRRALCVRRRYREVRRSSTPTAKSSPVVGRTCGSRSRTRMCSPAGRTARTTRPRKRSTRREAPGSTRTKERSVSGTAYPNPDYDNFSAKPVNYDVGIVELDEAADVTTSAKTSPRWAQPRRSSPAPPTPTTHSSRAPATEFRPSSRTPMEETAVQVHVEDRRGQREGFSQRQPAHVEQPQQEGWPRRLLLRRFRWTRSGEQHQPDHRRRLVRKQRNLPRR